MLKQHHRPSAMGSKERVSDAVVDSREETSGNVQPEISHEVGWGLDPWRCWRRAFPATA